MGLKLKDSVDAAVLREYGFELGSVLADTPNFRAVLGRSGHEYMQNWMHKYLMDEEDPGCIAYTDDEFNIPMVHMCFRLDPKFDRDLYIDVAPSCTYHIGGGELDIVTDTLYDMITAGILEKRKED